MKDSKVYADLIIAACRKIAGFIGDRTKEQFLRDSTVQSATLMQLHVIGETAKKIDEATQTQIEVPWKQIIGLRNIISHDYFSVKLDFVWDMASKDVPHLEHKLITYLQEEGSEYMPPFDDATPLLD